MLGVKPSPPTLARYLTYSFYLAQGAHFVEPNVT